MFIVSLCKHGRRFINLCCHTSIGILQCLIYVLNSKLIPHVTALPSTYFMCFVINRRTRVIFHFSYFYLLFITDSVNTPTCPLSSLSSLLPPCIIFACSSSLFLEEGKKYLLICFQAQTTLESSNNKKTL